MATVRDIVRAGSLEDFGLPEWEARSARRPLWVTPELLDWAYETAVLHSDTLKVGGRTLFEQLWQTFSAFRCDEHVYGGGLRRMIPSKKGIWHMYPPRLRVYGFVPESHAFVAVTAALEKATKDDRTLNDKKRDEVLEFARRHGLTATIKIGDHLALFPRQT